MTAGGGDGFDVIGVAATGTAAYASGSHGRIVRLVWGNKEESAHGSAT